MKNVFTVLIVSSLLSAPIFAYELNGDEMIPSHNHNTNSVASDNSNMDMMNMNEHKQMMQQMQNMMAQMHKNMSAENCEKMMEEIKKEDS